MARFYLTADNSRRNEVTAMSPSYCHIRGWTTGVEVHTDDDDGRDALRVYMTSGSSGSGERVLLGTVTEDRNHNPRFIPA